MVIKHVLSLLQFVNALEAGSTPLKSAILRMLYVQQEGAQYMLTYAEDRAAPKDRVRCWLAQEAEY
jgi:hypothetical protein